MDEVKILNNMWQNLKAKKNISDEYFGRQPNSGRLVNLNYGVRCFDVVTFHEFITRITKKSSQSSFAEEKIFALEIRWMSVISLSQSTFNSNYYCM